MTKTKKWFGIVLTILIVLVPVGATSYVTGFLLNLPLPIPPVACVVVALLFRHFAFAFHDRWFAVQ